MNEAKMRTGVEGLDEVLHGGLPEHNIYLLAGNPGTGKTTLALQFLLEGVMNGETGLYVTLSQSKRELQAVASSHGLSLEGVTLCDKAAGERSAPNSQYSAFHPSEVELGKTVKTVLDEVERVRPQRMVLDSISDLRLLAEDSLRFRMQILSFKQFFDSRQSTVVLLDDYSNSEADPEIEGLVHGVISLKCENPEYGAPRRRLRVSKIRGSHFAGGNHDFAIRDGGIVVYPRLEVGHRRFVKGTAFFAEIAMMDQLVGGGLDSSTAALILGPAGVGKSTLCAQYVRAACEKGRRAAYFTFDEARETMLDRTTALGMKLVDHVQAERLLIQQVNPDEMSPGEFSHVVRQSVEGHGAEIVVIDSLNGYHQAMSDSRFLTAHMNDLLAYLSQRGVLTMLVVGQHGVFGFGASAPIDLSYMADAVILLRYFEHAGEVRQAISISKKRSGNHERTIREFSISNAGVSVGKVLKSFQGILTGVPRYLSGDQGKRPADYGHAV